MKRVKIFIVLNIFVALLVLLFLKILMSRYGYEFSHGPSLIGENTTKPQLSNSKYNVWLIFVKVRLNFALKDKFNHLTTNLLNVSSVPLNFHVIVDSDSERMATDQFKYLSTNLKGNFQYNLYSIKNITDRMHDIQEVFTPHFSFKPGSYYSDVLFYVSLILYKIAPVEQELSVMLDCDLHFKDDILLLFKEFDRFKPTALFGLAPELTPVYRHILHKYRLNHITTFGDYYKSKNMSNFTHPEGFQGYNSGVILLNLRKIRESQEYSTLLSKSFVDPLVKKYMFKGHLGDQDYYTLLGYELPHLIQTINCGFNRQLCKWWKYGYSDVFDDYFKCEHRVVVLHGNCNTKFRINLNRTFFLKIVNCIILLIMIKYWFLTVREKCNLRTCIFFRSLLMTAVL
ncbi:hypothetical protein FQA39_LY03832 [Lamprigera yunnana]|nr:hypothetical protein FQA39_LY03832 [Lamprigera yunnana]